MPIPSSYAHADGSRQSVSRPDQAGSGCYADHGWCRSSGHADSSRGPSGGFPDGSSSGSLAYGSRCGKANRCAFSWWPNEDSAHPGRA